MKLSLLKAERMKRGWTQAKVAEAVGVDTRTVGRWERGKAFPYPYYREQLCLLFGKTAQQLGLLSAYQDTILEDVTSFGLSSSAQQHAVQSSFLVDPSMLYSLGGVTSLVGRHDILVEVKERLLGDENVVLQAMDSLPGIGKTALASVLAMDQQIQKHFCDGILWAGLGPKPNVLGHLARWGMLLGVMPSQVENISSREAWGRALRAAIGNRRLLLVISDAWSAEDVMALQVGGRACAHLVTTCFSDVALAFDQKGGITIAPLEESERIDLLSRFVPNLVEQDPQGALTLVQAVGGLPLALRLMGSYLALQDLSAQSSPLQRALAVLHETQERLGESQLSRSALSETLPLSLHAVIAMCDQQLSPQAHQALCALALFPPKPESFSQEVALAVTQQPVEVLDTLCDAGLIEVWGPGRYLLHQAVADYIHSLQAQSKVSSAQEQQVSSLLEDDMQVHKSNAHLPQRSLFAHFTLLLFALQNVRLRMSRLLTFRLFKRLSLHSWLVLLAILSTILVIIAFLLVFRVFFLYKSVN
jgi:transcriptional regulator with XRE-family HTH domain